MCAYLPQYKNSNGDMVDLELCATHDGNGNNIADTYARKDELSSGGSSSGSSSGGGITEIATQVIRITNLETGVYKLTYNGTKAIQYNGSTGMQRLSIIDTYATNPIILNVTQSYVSSSGVKSWQWYFVGSVQGLPPSIFYGYTSTSAGYYDVFDFASVLYDISAWVKNNLTSSTNTSMYALSAYQGYLLNQRLLSLESGRDSFRGKNLGTSITTAQLDAIDAGDFSDLCIGDYWQDTTNSVIWRIVDRDYWYMTGDVLCTDHHLVIMPDSPIVSSYSFASSDVSVAYANSVLRSYDIHPSESTSINSILSSFFGSNNLLNHREYLVNALTNGVPSGGAWMNSIAELPSEIMMYGTRIYAPTNNGTTVPCSYTNSRSQLALFRVAPQFIRAGSDSYFWLRDVVSSSQQAAVSSDGEASWRKPSKTAGIRPVFGVWKYTNNYGGQ